MKKFLLPLGVLLAGAGVGGGAAYGTSLLLGGGKPAAAQPEPDDTAFVPAAKILAPLVGVDGRLVGYVSLDIALEVDTEEAESVTARLPLLLHAINMRTYRTPMSAGPDGLLPDLRLFRKLVMDSAKEAFGAGVVKRAAVTGAVPV